MFFGHVHNGCCLSNTPNMHCNTKHTINLKTQNYSRNFKISLNIHHLIITVHVLVHYHAMILSHHKIIRIPQYPFFIIMKFPVSCEFIQLSTYINDHSPIAWYRTLIVVGWCNTRISPSNSQHALGSSFGETITIPFRIEDRFTYNKIKIIIWRNFLNFKRIKLLFYFHHSSPFN